MGERDDASCRFDRVGSAQSSFWTLEEQSCLFGKRQDGSGSSASGNRDYRSLSASKCE